MEGDFSRNIRIELIAHRASKGIKEKPYLANGHLLTRIVYQALGMMDELLPPISLEEVALNLGPKASRGRRAKQRT